MLGEVGVMHKTLDKEGAGRHVSQTNLNIQVCSLFGQVRYNLMLPVQCSQVKTGETCKHTPQGSV